MTGTNLVKTLTTKYAKLLGEYEFAERTVEDAVGLDAIIEATNRCDARKAEIVEKLEAIETVIWMFDEGWDPAIVRPNYPRKKHLKPGAISRAAYAILRDAKFPMTSREIARVVAERLGYGKLEEREMARIDNAIFNAMSDRTGKMTMIVSRDPTRWALIPRDQVQTRSQSRISAASAAPAESEQSAPRPARRYAS